ncbi:hypothetical protein Bbelb_428750 [Branchiostoma belcheri]|nr:hypothetical protein Bbelb_428750 [Branchiostoma belcheri]
MAYLQRPQPAEIYGCLFEDINTLMFASRSPGTVLKSTSMGNNCHIVTHYSIVVPTRTCRDRTRNASAAATLPRPPDMPSCQLPLLRGQKFRGTAAVMEASPRTAVKILTGRGEVIEYQTWQPSVALLAPLPAGPVKPPGNHVS